MAASSGWLTTMRETAAAQLERVAGELRKNGSRVETRVLTGEPSSSILETAQEVGARFIAMGTHGRKGAARLFLGSVAERVSAGARCPVIVASEATAPASHWPVTRRLNLAIATDGSPLGEAALEWARDIRRAIPSDIAVIRIYSPPREAARYGLDDPWVGRQGHPQLVQLIERDLRRELKGLDDEGDCRLRLVPATGSPADELAVELSLLQPDAVVVGVGKHRMTWPDLPVAAVLRASPVPVICVSAGDRPAPAIPRVHVVLVPTDLTEPSSQALLTAYGLLRPHGGRVELCTVHERGPDVEAADLRLALALDEKQRGELEGRLRAMVPAAADATGVVTRTSVIEGRRAAHEILQAAERLGVDLVVMGSHGRSGIKRALLGSVAEEVARHSRVPVVLVHGPGRGQR
jgi:nucleotide-binding universal stress UspA family protein